MRRLVLALALLSPSACQSALVVPAAQAPATRPVLQLSPAESEEAPATLAIAIAARDRAIQSLPGAWDTATLRLDHPTRLTAPRLRTLSKGIDMVPNGTGGYVANGAFGGRLRPGAGYTLLASLWSGGPSGTLMGERQITTSLVAGANAITLPIEVYPALGLTSYSANWGMAGDTITLQGKGISVDPSNDLVSLGGLSAAVGLASSVSLNVTVPNLTPGTYTWQLQVGSSLATLTGFDVLGVAGARQIWVSLASHQYDPTLAWGSDRYLVVWYDDRNGTTTDLFGKFVAADGSALSSDINLTNSTSITQKRAHVAYNPALNQFLIAWEQGGSGSGIQAQLVNGDGTLAGAPIPIAVSVNSQDKPQVTYNPTNQEYLVVWTDHRNGAYDVIGQRLSSAGALVGSNLELMAASGVQQDVGVAYSATSGKYLVVWQDHPHGKREIHAHLVNPDGTVAVGPIDVSGGTSSDQQQPAVAVDSTTGDFLVVWVLAKTPNLVMGQRVSSNGALVGSAVTISNATGTKTYPRLAYEPWRQKFLVVWNDDRNASTDVYGQYLSISGSLWGGNFGVDTSTGSQTPCDVAVSPTARQGLVAIQDSAGGGDIVGKPVP